jgi:hypothetical protein
VRRLRGGPSSVSNIVSKYSSVIWCFASGSSTSGSDEVLPEPLGLLINVIPLRILSRAKNCFDSRVTAIDGFFVLNSPNLGGSTHSFTIGLVDRDSSGGLTYLESVMDLRPTSAPSSNHLERCNGVRPASRDLGPSGT